MQANSSGRNEQKPVIYGIQDIWRKVLLSLYVALELRPLSSQSRPEESYDGAPSLHRYSTEAEALRQ
jgi:hypothetical protein